MKKIYLIAWLVVAGGSLRAQTNAAAAPPPRPPTLINSDRAEFDLTARRAVYHGNVRVDDPQMILTCELLTADLPQPGGLMKHIVAETNVVIYSVDEKGQTNHATSDQAVYDYNVQDGVTNETVTLTGNAKMENSQSTLTGEPIIWDRVNNRLTATDQKMIFRQNIASALTSTNSSPHQTNAPPAAGLPKTIHATNLPAMKNPVSPGTISNLDSLKP